MRPNPVAVPDEASHVRLSKRRLSSAFRDLADGRAGGMVPGLRDRAGSVVPLGRAMLLWGPNWPMMTLGLGSARLPASAMSTLMLAVPVTGLGLSTLTLHGCPGLDLIRGAIVIGVAASVGPARRSRS
ncbi:hypothetical protein AEGHOMDF_2965 [Methylobacterium soli]|nr:hypothetical protein AEGHOMDF_2965 [Methylobacterium soli]